MYREIKEEELKLHKGYFYFNDASHPLANSSNIVYYHRHIASIKEGRWLTTEEHVHHIDEDKTNNVPSNLQVLTNSEHSRIHSGDVLEKTCPICKENFIPRVNSIIYCSNKCAHISTRKLDGLNKEELEYLIWTKPFTALGEQFKVSDNAIRKWAKRLGCILPPRYFHSKVPMLRDKLLEYNKFKLERSIETK